MKQTDLLTANELAAWLRVRPATIRRWSQRGRIPRVELSPKVIRYRLEEVVAALQSGSKEGEIPDGT